MGTTGQSITLANSIIGVGILAMPFCFQQCGVILATLILISMGLVSRLCCYFLLKSALLARRRNFEFLAFHVFGSAGKLAVEVGIIGFLMGTCIAYFVVVGDLGPQIVSKMFNINQSDILRTSIMVIVSLVCVLPLGLLRNVDSLSNVSAATIGFYFCLVMKVIVEAASQLPSGAWRARLETWRPAGVLQCVPIFSMALFCQTQLFEIFESLPTLSLEKMNVVTKNAINICTGVYFTLGLFGYVAFCAHDISGNILMSLSPTMASDVIKLGFVMSLAFSFPLIIFPCRASLYSFLYRKVHPSHHDHIINHSIPETTFRCITVAIVGVSLFISLLIPNIELVLGLVGSTIGVLVCVVFPAACFLNLTFKNTNERLLAKAVLVLGLFIMVLGTYANLEAAESKLDRYDDKVITQERIDKIVEDFFEKMEKSEDTVIIKPPDKDEGIQNVNANKIEEVLKDSEVQPPNPVEPESHSNEKNPVAHSPEPIKDVMETIKEKKEIKEDKAVPVDDVADKVSEGHPKNLKNKSNGAKIGNGASNAEENVDKLEEAKLSKDEVKVKSEVEKTQEKNDMLKQQQLIETIKQHGEEQKELIKEQKEILDEIIKTKNEMQQNKKEVDSNEAKKIAVESIQKIANMAIQSLSGVSDKPADKDENSDKKSEPLEKIANEAVQEIAKKAVETMEAIKEINEKPKEQTVPKVANMAGVINGNVPIGQPSNDIANPELVQNNIQVNANLANPVGQQNLNSVVNANSIVPNEKNEANQQADVNYGQHNENVQQVRPNYNGVAVVPNNILPSNQFQKINQPVQGNVIQNMEVPAKVRLPVEPQSYKQEDKAKDTEANLNKLAQNVPLPLVINGNSLIKNQPPAAIAEASKPSEGEKVINNINVQNKNVQNGAFKDNTNNIKLNNNEVPVRQKREVVDCTKTMSLKPEDKEICKAVLGSTKFKDNTQEILDSTVDLNDQLLPKSLPVDALIHHMRSLKSYDETEKKR